MSEPLTTPAKVKSIAKHLSSLSDEQVLLLIEDAQLEVEDLPVATKYKEKLTRYLAAHFCSLNIRQAQSETVGPIKRTFTSSAIDSSKGLDATPFGQEYQRLLESYKPKKINLTVI
ncbi:DUF4054 domain-containing protein [Metabacillus fastidiosus]|uniref:DUF4054 domain-containing protein n=1 Tax=Metabacillus fastidiosus TaxID=1458 RepID=UPI002E248562|nr:DUF4054 domain-containing protein [Metabacillus fastidiosus]